MHLHNVIGLTHGVLRSNPTVSTFDGIVIDPKRVKRGALFVALNPYDVPLALENGAYGVLFERHITPINDDTAWIEVEDIYAALMRLMRFVLLDKELYAFTCNRITLHVAKQLHLEGNCLVLEGSLHENFDRLMGAPQGATLLFSDQEIRSDLFIDVSALNLEGLEPITLLEQTLFECSFIYRERYFERQLLSPLFIPELEALLQLLHERGIGYKIRPFTHFGHFQPLFVNAALQIKEFGSSDRVLIFEPDCSLIPRQMDFIASKSPWAKVRYCLPRGALVSQQSNDIIWYDTTERLLESLHREHYHFALVAGEKPSILERQRLPMRNQQKLFEE
ncbi:MAG: hypothetical protein JXK05_10645 [Campylobacterales bacterium]|nr:hypothetical protein [Campylobacterales bacterium]